MPLLVLILEELPCAIVGEVKKASPSVFPIFVTEAADAPVALADKGRLVELQDAVILRAIAATLAWLVGQARKVRVPNTLQGRNLPKP